MKEETLKPADKTLQN